MPLGPNSTDGAFERAATAAFGTEQSTRIGFVWRATSDTIEPRPRSTLGEHGPARSRHDDVVALRMDLLDREAPARLIAEAVDRNGGVDVLVKSCPPIAPLPSTTFATPRVLD